MSPCARVEIGGSVAIVVCYSGGYTHRVWASCPWCCLGHARTVHGFRFVHRGWCAPDLICGRCGQYWSADMDRRPRTSTRERAENIATVRALRSKPALRDFPLPPDLEPKA